MSVPPVPQLPEGAVARIERDLFAELDREPSEVRPARRWPYAAALLAACAASAFFGVRAMRHRQSFVYPDGAQIATRETAFHIPMEGAALDLAPQSAVHFDKAKDGSTLVVLERGRVSCEVAPRPRTAPFVVLAGRTRVIVVGTRFSVERQGDHAAVQVEQGTVEVVDGPADEHVGAGERYLPATETKPVAAEPPPAEPAPRTLALAPAPKKIVAPPPAETPAPVQTPPPAPKTISAQERFESAARLEKTDPEAALRAYTDLAAGSSEWSANALFAAAHLEVERGHNLSAKRLLQTYLERFPRGINAEDARDLLSTIK